MLNIVYGRKSNSMSRILVLGAPIFQVEVIKKAKELGNYVGAIDINADAPAFPYADECFVCSIRDYEGVLKIAKDFKPDGILIGACDTSVVTGARICQTLGLPGHTVDTAIKSTDKVKMLEVFQEHDVAHPLFQVIKKDSVLTISNDIAYPLITKPTDSAGGRGVCIVHNEEELSKAVEFSSNAGQSGDVLIEEYMKGPEVSVEMIIVDGIPYVLQITDKITSGEPNFFEIGHSQPSVLPLNIKERITELACKAVKAVGLRDSPAHIEIIITDKGPRMVELGARLGGDCITSYLIDESVIGINMTEATIKLCLGIKPDVTQFSNSGVCSAVRFIPAKEGTLKGITGEKEAEALMGVKKICITGKIGKHYSDATDDSARFGYVVCVGNSTEEALQRCQNAINTIRFELE